MKDKMKHNSDKKTEIEDMDSMNETSMKSSEVSDRDESASETEIEEPVELTPLEIASRKSAEYLDALQRLKAEFDNYRKRSARDSQRLSELHQSLVLESILPTLDSFDAALNNPSGKVSDDVLKGLRLIYDGLMSNLGKLDFKKMDILNKPFDPELAEALMTQPSDAVEPDTIIGEVSAGYMFKNSVLRPARVIVSVAEQTRNDD